MTFTGSKMDEWMDGQVDKETDRQTELLRILSWNIIACGSRERHYICVDVCLCVFMAHMRSAYISDSQCRGGVDGSGTDPTTGGQMDGTLDQGWHRC